MAIAFLSTFDPPADTGERDVTWFAEQIADRVNQQLGQGPPAGGIYHAEGPTNDGRWWSFDVWDAHASKEAFESEILTPILDEFGIKLSEAQSEFEVWWESSQAPPPA